MGTLLLALAVAMILATAVLVTALLDIERRSDAVLGVGVVSACLVVADCLALGALTLFSRWLLIGLAAVQLATVAAVVAWRPAARGRIAALPTAARSAAGEVFRALRGNPFAATLFLLATLLFAWRAFVALSLGVQDYDGLSYHMPMVLSWVQDHRVGQRIIVNPFADAYPGNLELQAAWAMAIEGTTRFAALTQLPFAILATAAVAAMGLRCGLSLGWALAAAGLFAMTPIVLAEIATIYNDVAAATMFVAGLHLAGRVGDTVIERSAWARYAVLAAFALGFAAGTKPSFVIGAAAVFAVVVAAAAWRTRSWRRPAMLAGILAALIALIGAPFYLRNILLFDNPLAPFALDVGPIHFPGKLDLDVVTIDPSTPPEFRDKNAPITLLLWFGYQVKSTYGVQGGVQANLGWQWPLLLVPAMAGWLVLVIARKRTWYYATLALPMATVVLTHPTPWIFRYVLFLVAPAAVALCLGLQWLAARRKAWSTVACVALCLVALTCVILPLDGFRNHRTGQAGITAVRRLSASELVRETLDGRRLQIYDQPGARWFQSLPSGTVIAVSGRATFFPTPLYGRRAQNRVVWVSFHPADVATYLDRNQVNYLVTGEGDAVDKWAGSQPDRFELVQTAATLRTYRVR